MLKGCSVITGMCSYAQMKPQTTFTTGVAFRTVLVTAAALPAHRRYTPVTAHA